MLLAGCSNEFAEEKYDSEEIIAKIEDRCVQTMSVSNTNNGEYTLTILAFHGRETIWTDKLKQDQEIANLKLM